MRVGIKREKACSPYELARVTLDIEGVGKVYGHSLRRAKDGKSVWLAPPSINGKNGWTNVITLNGSLRESVKTAVETMSDGDEKTLEYAVSETPLAVYVNPFEGGGDVLAMGSLTIKNVLSVNSCIYKKAGGSDATLHMPSWYSAGKKQSVAYFYLDRSLYGKVQKAADDSYKAKKTK